MTTCVRWTDHQEDFGQGGEEEEGGGKTPWLSRGLLSMPDVETLESAFSAMSKLIANWADDQTPLVQYPALLPHAAA